MVHLRIWRQLSIAAMLCVTGWAAQAQTPLNPSLPPPNFRTTIVVRLFCGQPICPEQTYVTHWVTNALGDVYAADSGILYPLNKELPIHQFPISLREYAVPGTNVTGILGSSFRGDIFTTWYEMRASAFQANFKMRVRFHPFSRKCELLTWEYWGRSAGMSLARALVSGQCSVQAPGPAAVERRAPPRAVFKG